MLPAFAACANELVARWEGYVESDGAKEIDVWPEFQNLTGDVISRSAFGSSFSEGRRIFQLQSEQSSKSSEDDEHFVPPGFQVRTSFMSICLSDDCASRHVLMMQITDRSFGAGLCSSCGNTSTRADSCRPESTEG